MIAGFASRHIGTLDQDKLKEMLTVLKADSLDQLISETIPGDIRISHPLNIPEALSEQEYLRHMRTLADQNLVQIIHRSWILWNAYSFSHSQNNF